MAAMLNVEGLGTTACAGSKYTRLRYVMRVFGARAGASNPSKIGQNIASGTDVLTSSPVATPRPEAHHFGCRSVGLSGVGRFRLPGRGVPRVGLLDPSTQELSPVTGNS